MATLKSSGCHYVSVANGTTTPVGVWSYRGDYSLTDGVVDYGDSNWTWIQYRDYLAPNTNWMGVILDLGQTITLSYARFAYHAYSAADVFAHSQVVISGSLDNVTYNTLGTFNSGTDWSTDQTPINPMVARWTNSLSISGTYRYIYFNSYFNTPSAWDTAHSFSEIEVYGDSAIIPTTNYLSRDRTRNRLNFKPLSLG